VGARLSRGAVGLSSVDLLLVYSHSAPKKSLDFRTFWGGRRSGRCRQLRDSGEATGKDRVGDAATFLGPGRDGPRTVLEP